jgi:exodeoxyribonuclease VII small subunit
LRDQPNIEYIPSDERQAESSSMSTSTPPPTYETLYARMQAIVARMETGELPLAEALALYEEGMTVTAACQRLLDEAELRVQELQPGSTLRRTDAWEE